MDAINADYDALENGKAGSTVTLPRILICIAAAAVVIAALGAALSSAGALRGEAGTVLAKAVRICPECMGLG